MSGIGQDPSDFGKIEEWFKDIILSSRDKDSSGRDSSMLCTRKTYILTNGTKLYVTEHYTRDAKIDHYFYDWVNGNGTEILKFHSEAHEDEDYQTETEPYHIHTNHESKLTNVPRLPTIRYRDLFSVFEFLRAFMYAQEAIQGKKP